MHRAELVDPEIRLPSPTRSWEKITGPGESSFTAIAITSISGMVIGRSRRPGPGRTFASSPGLQRRAGRWRAPGYGLRRSADAERPERVELGGETPPCTSAPLSASAHCQRRSGGQATMTRSAFWRIRPAGRAWPDRRAAAKAVLLGVEDERVGPDGATTPSSMMTSLRVERPNSLRAKSDRTKRPSGMNSTASAAPVPKTAREKSVLTLRKKTTSPTALRARRKARTAFEAPALALTSEEML